MNDMRMIIGEKIKEYRKSGKLSQQQFAEQMNVSKQTVSKWETGGCYPDLFLLPRLADALHCSIDDFFTA